MSSLSDIHLRFQTFTFNMVHCTKVGLFDGSGGARAGLDGATAPSETCLAPAQPPQRYPNDFPDFNSVSLSLLLKNKH